MDYNKKHGMLPTTGKGHEKVNVPVVLAAFWRCVDEKAFSNRTTYTDRSFTRSPLSNLEVDVKKETV